MFTVSLGIDGRLAKPLTRSNPVESMISIARTTNPDVTRWRDGQMVLPNDPSAASRATSRWPSSSRPCADTPIPSRHSRLEFTMDRHPNSTRLGTCPRTTPERKREAMRNRIHALAAGLTVLVALATPGCSANQASPTPPQQPPAITQPLASPPALPSQDEIAALFDQWNAALATGDPEKVADLYAPNAVLLPTMSNQIRTTRAEIVDYFTHFLESKPRGSIDRAVITVIDPQTAINTGIYTFELIRDGQLQNIQARYTFAYQKQNGKWLIVNHHSSTMPEPVPAR